MTESVVIEYFEDETVWYFTDDTGWYFTDDTGSFQEPFRTQEHAIEDREKMANVEKKKIKATGFNPVAKSLLAILKEVAQTIPEKFRPDMDSIAESGALSGAINSWFESEYYVAKSSDAIIDVVATDSKSQVIEIGVPGATYILPANDIGRAICDLFEIADIPVARRLT